QVVVGFKGSIDEERLRTAASGVLKRHESLRSAFMNEGLRQPVQVIAREVELPWEQIDLSGLEREQQTNHLGELLESDRMRRFDTARAPLLRFTLIRLAAEEFRLVLTNHHLLLDGWSTPVVLEELMKLYESKGDSSVLPRV